MTGSLASETVTCPNCNGSGVDASKDLCSYCYGKGTYRLVNVILDVLADVDCTLHRTINKIGDVDADHRRLAAEVTTLIEKLEHL